MIVDNTVEFRSTPVTGVELLIGAGNRREKEMGLPDKPDWQDLVTLDIDPDSNPDVLWDLNHIPLPFDAGSFEEIHAYDVLEHLGQQGDWKSFFQLFEEFYRILKPGGLIFAATPMWDSEWAWADPGHRRIISQGTLVFLDQQAYQEQVGKKSMTDYRHWYQADFETVFAEEVGERFAFVLKKR